MEVLHEIVSFVTEETVSIEGDVLYLGSGVVWEAYWVEQCMLVKSDACCHALSRTVCHISGGVDLPSGKSIHLLLKRDDQRLLV